MKPDYILKPGMTLLGIEKLRAHQLKPIQSLMQGNDTIVIAGTASGKSAIYQLPALIHSDQLTLVIEPTLSLIYNQVQSLQECGIHADYIDHFRTKKDVDAILHKAKKGKLTFLYVTPERLQSKTFQDIILDTPIYMVVIDECHCVTEWGNTFRDAYLKDKMRKIVMLSSKYESLIEVQGKMKVSRKKFKALLDKFDKLGINPITRTAAS